MKGFLLLLILPLVYGDEELSGSRLVSGVRMKRASTGSQITNLTIVTIENPPYVYTVTKEGKTHYYGFLVDYIDAITKRLQLDYYFYLVPDGRYGSLDEATGEWSGMVGELIKMERAMNSNQAATGAHIAAAPLTISKNREEVIDFVNPFQHLTLSILIKKPYNNMYLGEDMWSQSFQVLYPLAPEVWAFTVLAYFAVSGLLYLMNRINPYEWSARHDIGRADEEHAETFNLSGSLWYTFTTLQWQGYERSPRSISARVLSGFWFAFVSLTMLTYTGALVNHLFWSSTVHGKGFNAPPFISMEELIMNKEYSYGVFNKGQTYRYLTQNAKGAEYNIMRDYWESDEGKKQLASSQQDGLNKVLGEKKYALIGESMILRHMASTNCQLLEIPTTIGKRQFGLGVYNNMDRKIFDGLHSVTLEMMEEGDIEALENKWWYEKGLCWNVTKAESMIRTASHLELNKPKRIDLKLFWGPLLLVLMGVIISTGVLIAEVLYYKFKGRYASVNRPGGQQLKLEEET